MTMLPPGWALKSLSDVCLPVMKADPVSTGHEQVRYVDIGSVDGERHSLPEIPWVYSESAPSRCRQIIGEGDTLFSTVRPYLEKIAFVDSGLDGEFASTGFCVLRPGPKVLPRYLFHYSVSRSMLDQVLRHQRGVSYPAVLDKRVKAATIPLPPLEEQRRIVDILEDHLSRLDAAEHGLKLALRRLASYEAVALSLCRDGIENPLGDVTEIQGGIQKQPKRAPKQNAYPFLRVANVTKNGLDLDEVHLVELFDGELDRLRLQPGDLLVVEGNGSPSQIGRAALWDGSIADCVHQNHLIRVRPKSGLSAPYLEAVWNSPQNRRQLTDLASSSSGLHTLSVSKLKSLKLPVSTLDRQRELVAEVQDIRDRRRRLDTELNLAVSRAQQLRRSLLAAAFAGRLTGHSTDIEMVEEMAGV
jgi:type I restriction enzyme S subunit